MLEVTAAVTPKGERRRYALVSAAADLLCEGGFDAVRHRAVARRAGLPLASTTYYFSSLDDLIVKAVEHVGALEAQQLRERVAGLSRRRRGAEATVDVLVDLLVGDDPEPAFSLLRTTAFVAPAPAPPVVLIAEKAGGDLQLQAMNDGSSDSGLAMALRTTSSGVSSFSRRGIGVARLCH